MFFHFKFIHLIMHNYNLKENKSEVVFALPIDKGFELSWKQSQMFISLEMRFFFGSNAYIP